MLTVSRNENQVEVKISIPVPLTNGYTYTLKWAAVGGDDHAGFVAGKMQEAIGDHLMKQREIWYLKGWHDAKSKKVPKRTWFPKVWEWLN